MLVSFLVEALRRRPVTPKQLRWAPEILVHYVEVNGIRLRYIKAGQGPVLVLFIRSEHKSDPALTTLFYSAVAGTLFCGVLLPLAAIVPDSYACTQMLLLGLMGVASHFCLIRAFTAAPAYIVAPFGYASLIWAALFSLLIFAEPPSLITIFGAGMIAVSGVFIYIRRKETI